MASADPYTARFAGWRVALRVARRDALRSRGRSALVIVMIGLPVLLSTVIAVLTSSQSISPVEGLPRTLGAAQAQLIDGGREPIVQDPFGSNVMTAAESSSAGTAGTVGTVGSSGGATVVSVGSAAEQPKPWTAAELARLTGGQVATVLTGTSTVLVPGGRAQVDLLQTDADPRLLRGTVEGVLGGFPQAPDEVLVSPALKDRGFDVGDTIRIGPDRRAATVVGVGLFTANAGGVTVLTRPGLIEPATLPGQTTFLLNRPTPVRWDEVLKLNRVGIQVLSRAVVMSPPPADQVDPRLSQFRNGDSQTRTVLGIIVTSVGIEVVLLTGPAFAVGVRRQQRQLALLAATGANRAQLRRSVLAGGVVLGLGASVLGAALGLLLSVGLVLGVNHFRPYTFGPLDITWWVVVAVAALGTVAALTAALVPARQASRLDVVAALTGRRAEARASRGWPLAGVVLAGAGAAITLVLGTRSSGENMVAIGTIVAVLGLVALMPFLVGQVGRLARGLPVPLRIAVRDSARHRTRTAPAVAAVMGVVAGMTALAIGGSSDALERRATYVPELAMGATRLQLSTGADLAAVTAAARRVLPGSRWLVTGSPGTGFDPASTATPQAVAVVPQGCTAQQVISFGDVDARCNSWQLDETVTRPAGSDPTSGFASTASGNGLVSPLEALPALRYHVTAEQQALLRRGGILVTNPKLIGPDGTATVIRYPMDGSGGAVEDSTVKESTVAAAYLAPEKRPFEVFGIGMIATPETMQRLGVPWVPERAVLASGGKVTGQQEDRLSEAVRGVDENASAYTERGFRDELRLAFLILAGAAAVAVLIGTLTATGLALADARPDLATLAAVGASPRSRRIMAGAHALVIGLLGTVTGTALGFLPGISVAYPLTITDYGQGATGPYIGVPWTMLLAVALLVPLFAAAVAAISHRTRQPMTHRV
jgi:putative ABC transport system permease protein